MRPPLGPNELSCSVAKLALPITRLSIMRPATLTRTFMGSSISLLMPSYSANKASALCWGFTSFGKAGPWPACCAARKALSLSRRSAMSWFSS